MGDPPPPKPFNHKCGVTLMRMTQFRSYEIDICSISDLCKCVCVRMHVCVCVWVLKKHIFSWMRSPSSCEHCARWFPASLSSYPRCIAKLHPQSFVTSSLKDNNGGKWEFSSAPASRVTHESFSGVWDLCHSAWSGLTGSAFYPPSSSSSSLKMAPSLQHSVPNTNFSDKRTSDWCCESDW